MHRFSRSAALPIIVAVAAAWPGCGRTQQPPASQPPPAQMADGSHGAVSVVLTPLGAQRTGIQTAMAARAGQRGQAWSRTPPCSTSPTAAT